MLDIIPEIFAHKFKYPDLKSTNIIEYIKPNLYALEKYIDPSSAINLPFKKI